MSVFKPHIAAIGAYSPPLEGRDPARHQLLDFNERTLPVGKAVEQALVDYIRAGRLQAYPSYGAITAEVAAYAGVDPSQVLITNGSDQGIELACRATLMPGDEVIIPAPSFPFYNQCAKVENATILEPRYTRAKGYPTAEVLALIGPATRMICIANPNNPSGTLVPRADILAICRAAPNACVLVDECYFEYSGETVADCVEEFPNLVITRTFSKTFGIPSLRFGYIISCAANIVALHNVRGPYDVNQLAVVAVRAALAAPTDVQRYVREVMDESKPMLERFFGEHGIEFWPSGGNFLWAFFPEPERVYQALLDNRILTRPKADPDGRPGLRITLGTRAQTEQLIEVLRTALPNPTSA